MQNNHLAYQINQLPTDMQQQVADFVAFLVMKAQMQNQSQENKQKYAAPIISFPVKDDSFKPSDLSQKFNIQTNEEIDDMINQMRNEWESGI